MIDVHRNRPAAANVPATQLSTEQSGLIRWLRPGYRSTHSWIHLSSQRQNSERGPGRDFLQSGVERGRGPTARCWTLLIRAPPGPPLVLASALDRRRCFGIIVTHGRARPSS